MTNEQERSAQMKSRGARLVQWEGWGPAIIEGHRVSIWPSSPK
jgi:hypothetical protein